MMAFLMTKTTYGDARAVSDGQAQEKGERPKHSTEPFTLKPCDKLGFEGAG